MCLYGLFENMKIRFSPFVAQCVACFGLGLAVAGLILVCGCGSPVEPEPEPEPETEFSIGFSWTNDPYTYPDSTKVYADGELVFETNVIRRNYHFNFSLADFSPETVFEVYVFGVPEQYTENYWCKMEVCCGYVGEERNVIITLIDVVPNPVFTFSLPAWLYE